MALSFCRINTDQVPPKSQRKTSMLQMTQRKGKKIARTMNLKSTIYGKNSNVAHAKPQFCKCNMAPGSNK